MNFLAHIYLSKENTDLMLGNFLGDFVRGNKYKNYNPTIQKGILLHRHIDTFTDAHKIVRISKRRLHERYGHYDGIIIDLFYDHFLAKNWGTYSEIPLDIYAKRFYQLLHDNYTILPEKAQYLLPYLEKYNWLYNYQYIEGMKTVLEGMNRRTKMISKMDVAIEDLKIHYSEFENDFTAFFKELIIELYT
ncbi:MAG: acyl carrier protein phosphodiesterase [Flavobacteriaceae bacterium]|nr:acyl carrier protein phosphodiesterase [Flavobacteriaceae bacterium]